MFRCVPSSAHSGDSHVHVAGDHSHSRRRITVTAGAHRRRGAYVRAQTQAQQIAHTVTEPLCKKINRSLTPTHNDDREESSRMVSVTGPWQSLCCVGAYIINLQHNCTATISRGTTGGKPEIAALWAAPTPSAAFAWQLPLAHGEISHLVTPCKGGTPQTLPCDTR